MKNISIKELKEVYHNRIISAEDFEKLEENKNVKLIQFRGSELGIKDYPVSKYGVLLEDRDVITIYKDIPTW